MKEVVNPPGPRDSDRRQPASILALIHTVSTLPALFEQLAREMAPGSSLELAHTVDESLLKVTRQFGLIPRTCRHILSHALAAQEVGAGAILLTCSSVGGAVPLVAPLLDVPLLRVDLAMVDEALSIGSRVGVAATLSSTLDPTVELVRERAAVKGIDVDLEVRLCDGAFEAARSGQIDLHDRTVSGALESLSGNVDVVILAQASMARVAAMVDLGSMPILSSPRSALRSALDQLAGVAGTL